MAVPPRPGHGRTSAAVRCGCVVLIFCLPALPAFAGDLAPWLEAHRDRHDLPALGAVVVSSSGIESLGVVGRRASSHDARVEGDDRWHLGSITKSMTATVAARLVEQGRIDFDTRVGTVLGEAFPSMRRVFRRVTLAELLGHRGGLPRDLVGLEVWEQLDIEADAPRSQRRALLEEVLSRRPALRPGSGHLYSNAGYVLAATMLEAVSGQSWEELMVAELFRPLALESAGIGAPGIDGEQPDQPWGHRAGNGLQPMPPGPFADHPPALGPAGTVHMNLADLGRYLHAHLVGLAGDTAFLPRELFQRLHAPLPGQDYALGWWQESSQRTDAAIHVHEGSNTFWFALVWLIPAQDVAIAVVTNRVPADLDATATIAGELLAWRQR